MDLQLQFKLNLFKCLCYFCSPSSLFSDHHKKANALKSLRIKAQNRNKDEFYFGMVNSKMEVGCYLFFLTIYAGLYFKKFCDLINGFGLHVY